MKIKSEQEEGLGKIEKIWDINGSGTNAQRLPINFVAVGRRLSN
jgi:hypothetical protein